MNDERTIEENETPGTPQRQAERVLVVDDEPEVARVLSRALTHAGYDTATAHGAQEALDLFGEGGYALLLSDIHMPGMHGDELQRIARERDPDLAVILITAAGDVACAVECMREGVFDYIIKPAPLADVVVRVNKALERRRMAIELRDYQSHLEERVSQQAERIRRLLLKSLQTLTNALEAKDEYTRDHSVRVAELATALAKRLHPKDTHFHTRIRLAGLIHDIGKIGVPESILKKPAKLAPEEYAEIQKHPVIGETILRPLLEGDDDILAVVRHHHERWDGKGYPDGLAGEATPLGARITAVADAFDAMRHARPYRQGMPLATVLQILCEGAGSQWDSTVINELMQMAVENELEAVCPGESDLGSAADDAPGGPFNRPVRSAKRGPSVPVHGLLDTSVAEKLEAKIDLVLGRGSKAFTLDLTEAVVGPSGAEFVHTLCGRMRKRGVQMVIRNASAEARQQLEEHDSAQDLVFERTPGLRVSATVQSRPKAA